MLGLVFLFVQGYEYYHAYADLNLKLRPPAPTVPPSSC
jgi:heme/copper-type cytochrome/quinol oxidase subunit 3